jgi:hypothetical protein
MWPARQNLGKVRGISDRRAGDFALLVGTGLKFPEMVAK